MEESIGTILHLHLLDGQAPAGTALCNGAVWPMSADTALAYLIGNQYGGDGWNTFALPDLRGKSPLDQDETDCHYVMVVTGWYPDLYP